MANKSKASGSNGASGSAKGKGQQPRSVSQDLTAQRPGQARKGLHLVLQQFGGPRKEEKAIRQLLLWEGVEEGPELEREVELTGLNLSVGQHKALHAVIVLLERTGYRGNIPPLEITSDAFKGKFTIPRILMTIPEYLEAYGLAPDTRGKARIMALGDLDYLTEPQRLAYRRVEYQGKGKDRRKQGITIVTRKPLISLDKIYRDPDGQVLRGKESPDRLIMMRIEYSPIVVDQIDTFYTLQPVRLHQEISGYLGHGRYSEAIPRFLDWLTTLDIPDPKIRKELLLERLRLDKMKEQKNTGRMRARLQEAIDVAQGLGYILSYSEDLTGLMYTFHLNPERCSRVKPGQIAGPDEEQEP